MFRGQKRRNSWNLSLQQHAGQSPIHIQIGSKKIDLYVKEIVEMHPHMQASLGKSACMYVWKASALSISWICFLFLSGVFAHWLDLCLVWWFPGPLWSIGTVPGPHRIRGVLSYVSSRRCVPSVRRGSRLALHYRRATSARCTLPFPDLPFPAVLLYLCVCISLLCVSDLAYLFSFVSLVFCYCRRGGRPSTMQPGVATLRRLRSCSRWGPI